MVQHFKLKFFFLFFLGESDEEMRKKGVRTNKKRELKKEEPDVN